MTVHHPVGLRRYARFLAQVLALTAGLAALGVLPTRELGGAGAVPAMLVGCAVSALASAVGGLAVAFARRPPREGGGPRAVVAAMALRFATAVAGTLAALLSGRFPRAPLLIWVAVSYCALLVIDTRYAVTADRGGEGGRSGQGRPG